MSPATCHCGISAISTSQIVEVDQMFSGLIRDWEVEMAEIPQWHVAGDWFDVCSCDIACPCIFGQPPTNNVCHGVLAYRVRDGHFGGVPLTNLKLVLAATLEGNIWAGQATGFKAALFVDN